MRPWVLMINIVLDLVMSEGSNNEGTTQPILICNVRSRATIINASSIIQLYTQTFLCRVHLYCMQMIAPSVDRAGYETSQKPCMRTHSLSHSGGTTSGLYASCFWPPCSRTLLRGRRRPEYRATVLMQDHTDLAIITCCNQMAAMDVTDADAR